ncbi:MAG: hypothetical protein R3D62_13130 [Xanthobacteraceae bacterium]
MQTSVFLAKLTGPVLLVAAIGLLVNARVYRAMAHDFLRSLPLVYVTGVLAMTAGVAIVLYHNVWSADWRVIITLLGWAATIGGAARIVLPDRIRTIGEAMVDNTMAMTIGGVGWVIIGAVLCYFGYFH